MINESHQFDFRSPSHGSRTPDKSPTEALIDAVLADRPTDIVDVAGSRGGVGPPRRAKMISGFGAVVATTAGKIALCTAVAAASVGGVYASTDRINGPGAADGPIVVDAFDAPAGVDETDTRSGVDETETENPSDEADGGQDVAAATGHGQEVAALATGSELGGCERGQEISELASANAAEHRQDPERDNEACGRSEDSAPIAAEPDTESDEQDGVAGSEAAKAASAGAQGVGHGGTANGAGKPDR